METPKKTPEKKTSAKKKKKANRSKSKTPKKTSTRKKKETNAPVAESGNGGLVQWNEIQSASWLLMAIFGGVMYCVFEYQIVHTEIGKTMIEKNPRLMHGLMLALRALPSFIACWTVRSTNDNIKNFKRATYVTFIDIGLIWCVASDVIECISADKEYQRLCFMGMAIVAHLSFVIAFTSELMGSNDLPPLQLPSGVFFASIAGALIWLYSKGNVLQGVQDKPEIAALIVSFCSTMWRAAARVGYGHDGRHVYASLPQWIGLLGAVSLAFSQYMYLGETESIDFVGIKNDDLKLARLTCYWIAIAAIAASALMPTSNASS